MKRWRWVVLPLMLFFIAACGGGGTQGTGTTSSQSDVPQNSTPVANAGTSQNVAIATLVRLNGSWSSDQDGDTLNYSWSLASKPAGSTTSLQDPSAVNPTFTPDIQGVYEFSLIVNDGKALSTPSEVSFTAMAGGEVLVLTTANHMEGWLVNEPLSSAEAHIRNGYPHLLPGWQNGTVRATEVILPTVDLFSAGKYEVVNWVIRKKLAEI